MCQQSFPSLRKVIGCEDFADLLERAQSQLGEFGLQQLERGLKTLADKVGMASVQRVYRKRLLEAIRQAPIRLIKAYDTVSQQMVEVKESPQLTQLSYEVLCLAGLAELADEMKLLLPKKYPTPEARIKLEGHECLVEVKCLTDPIKGELREERSIPIRAVSRPPFDPRLSGQSASSDQLPAYVHLRGKLEDSRTWKKFANSPNTVNLVFVLFFSPFSEAKTSYVPALYGERFLQVYSDLLEFRLPSPDELGEDGLFAKEHWRCVSGVVGIWTMSHPFFSPLQELRFQGVLFPNPKALTHIPKEVSEKLAAGFNLLLLDTVPKVKITRAQAEELYRQYVQPLEKQFWGRLAAVNLKGEVLLGDDEVELSQEAVKCFGKGEFVLFRIGPKAVGRI